MFYVGDYTTDSLSIASSNSGKEGSANAPTVIGYSPIGVLGVECSAWELPLSKVVMNSSGKFYWAVSNPKSVASTFTIHARFLYVKSSLL